MPRMRLAVLVSTYFPCERVGSWAGAIIALELEGSQFVCGIVIVTVMDM